MLLLLLDADRSFAVSLTDMLLRRGHCVQHELDEQAPADAVIVGLPAPDGLTGEDLGDTPLLLLVEGSLPFGALEAWIDGRTRWALLSKPVRESSLELSLERITRPVRGEPAAGSRHAGAPPLDPRRRQMRAGVGGRTTPRSRRLPIVSMLAGPVERLLRHPQRRRRT